VHIVLWPNLGSEEAPVVWSVTGCWSGLHLPTNIVSILHLRITNT